VSANRTGVRETMSEAAKCVNTERPLTRSTSTTPKEGLAMKATRIDLAGKRFDRLAVLHYVGGPQAAWECHCDCGNRKNIAGGDLRSGKTRSCGCLRRELVSQRLRLDDMTGQRFDRLVVLGFAEMRSGESIWHCACDCGAQIEARGWSLRSNGTKSCGCLHRERVREPRTDEPTYGAIHSRLAAAKGSARLQRCVDCADPAEQWSYDHQDAGELVSPLGHPFSTDLSHYDPRCLRCHRAFDVVNGGRNAQVL
jgi:hypothetical protein